MDSDNRSDKPITTGHKVVDAIAHEKSQFPFKKLVGAIITCVGLYLIVEGDAGSAINIEGWLLFTVGTAALGIQVSSAARQFLSKFLGGSK